MWLKLKLFFSDDKNFFITVIVGIILFFGIAFFGYKEVHTYLQEKSAVEKIETEKKENNKLFQQLWFNKRELSDGTYVLTYDLYLDDPFISSYQLNTKLKNFFDSVKIKYNVGDKPKVRAIGVRLYDRKVVWDKGLQPRGIAFYSISQDIANKRILEEEKKNKDKDENLEVKQLDGTKDVLTNGNQDSLMEQSWNYTLDPKTKIDYNEYDLTTSGFQQYNKNAVAKPLTDQEFIFWLKIKLYQKVLDAKDISSAVMLYMNYDLGGKVPQEDFLAIADEFKKFDKRQSDLGDNTDYYPNDVKLRKLLAVYRPQFLWYALSGENIKSRTTAQRKLIENDPNSYTQKITEHNKEVAKTTDEFGGQDYYKDDPFVAIVGPYKQKYPAISRKEFSPVLSENSSLFGKTIAAGQ